MSIQSFVFDYDGVVNPGQVLPSLRIIENHDLNREEVLRFFTGDFNDCLIGKRDTLEAIKANISNFDPREFITLWHKYHDVLDEEMVSVMQDLQSNGYQLCIATNQDSYRTQFIRDRLGPFLEISVYSSCEFGMEKKDPKFFEILKDKLGVEYGEMVLIDDSEKNIDSARLVGMEAYLFSSKEAFLKYLEEKVR